MKITETLDKLNKYQKLQKELEDLKVNQPNIEKQIIAEETTKYNNLSKTIQQFCGNESFKKIIVNLCNLYSGIISISGGNIVYRGNVLSPLSFNNDNVFLITRQCINDMKSAFVSLAGKTNNADSEARKLCVSFTTLRNINAKVFALKELAIKNALNKNNRIKQVEQEIDLLLQEYPDFKYPEKIQDQIKELKTKQQKEKDSFEFKNIELPIDYSTEISLPFAIKNNGEDINIKYWNPIKDGILHINVPSGDSGLATNFISALIMQFLYSYPMLDKQILYCCTSQRSEMDGFLENLKSKCNQSFFKEKTQLRQGKDSVDFVNTINDLRNEGTHRSQLINGKDIYKYNSQKDVTILSPILVILNDYPSCISGEKDLQYFFNECVNLGIYFVIIQTQTYENKNSYNEHEKEYKLEKYKKITYELTNDKKLYINNSLYDSISINTTNDFLEELLNHLIKTGKSKSFISNEDIGFGKIDLTTDGYCPKISIPIGKEDNKVFSLNIVVEAKEQNEATSYLIVGGTGSGKSVLLDSIILNGSMSYSPDDLIFYFLDFKDGVGAAAYDKENAIQHVKMIADKYTEEDADIILSELDKEKERRNEIFKANGSGDIASYNAKSNKKMPRIILIVDECQTLFESDTLSKKCEELIRKGRTTGIHLILASQKADYNIMKKAGEFIKGRICFYVEKDLADAVIDSSYTRSLYSDIPNGSGQAYISFNNGKTCEKIKVAFCGKGNEKMKYNKQIREKWQQRGYEVNLIKAGIKTPLPLESFIESNPLVSSSKTINLGLNYYDHSMFGLDFNGKDSHSIIIYGNKEKISQNILSSIIVKAIASGGKVKLIDASLDGVLKDFFANYANMEIGNENSYLSFLQEVYNEYSKRKSDIRADYEPYFFIINSLADIEEYEKNTAYESDKKDNNTKTDDWDHFYENKIRSTSDTIKGKETLLSILDGTKKNINMNFIIAFNGENRLEYNQKEVLTKCEYNIFQNNFQTYNEKLLQGLNENMVLVTNKNENTRIRYFQYDFTNDKTIKMINEAINRKE